MYKKVEDFEGNLICIKNKENNSLIPIDTANTDYQAIQEWAKTNTIEEAD